MKEKRDRYLKGRGRRKGEREREREGERDASEVGSKQKGKKLRVKFTDKNPQFGEAQTSGNPKIYIDFKIIIETKAPTNEEKNMCLYNSNNQ